MITKGILVFFFSKFGQLFLECGHLKKTKLGHDFSSSHPRGSCHLCFALQFSQLSEKNVEVTRGQTLTGWTIPGIRKYMTEYILRTRMYVVR